MDHAVVVQGKPLPNAPGDVPDQRLLHATATASRDLQQPAQYNNPSAREDKGANSLAARLAQEFPSARIIIGAPDSQASQEPRAPREVAVAPAPPAQDDLDSKMRRLQELLKR